MRKIQNYEDFVEVLLEAGFSMGGGNDEGIYAIVNWDWKQEAPYETPVSWHTGDRETDPWEWRMRILDERTDVAYAKCFFKKSGYITREWYPYFLACRRGGQNLEEMYREGNVSHESLRIYRCVEEQKILPLHELKRAAGFGPEDKSSFDRALVELQMLLFLTICGKEQKLSRDGKPYGWNSTAFCRTEEYWGPEVFARADGMTAKEAEEKIREQILRLNPEAPEKKIKKFIYGIVKK